MQSRRDSEHPLKFAALMNHDADLMNRTMLLMLKTVINVLYLGLSSGSLSQEAIMLKLE